MILLIAEWIPIAAKIGGDIFGNVMQGINNRAARNYNEPVNQVARLREAGLPTAAGSHITGGVQSPTPYNSVNTDDAFKASNDRIAAGNQRQIDRKKLQIMEEELRDAKARADISTGNAQNLTNPAGQYTNTNQGLSMWQTYQAQYLQNEASKINNSFLPKEKGLSLFKMSKDIEHVTSQIKNNLAQNKILLAEGSIKNILAEYQDRMSSAELTNVIRRNTNLRRDYEIKQVELNLAWATLAAKTTIARNEALRSGEMAKAAQLSNLMSNLHLNRTRLEQNSAQTWFDAKARVDARFKANQGGALNDWMKDMIYIGMHNPGSQNMESGTSTYLQLLNLMK